MQSLIKNYIRCVLAIAFAALFMVSCSTNQNETIYDYSPPTSVDGQACVDECKQSKAICYNQCTAPSAECVARQEQRAQRHYNQYMQTQQTLGQTASRSYQSFFHPEKCEHTGCGCAQNYDICYQLCGTRSEVHTSIATQ